eukprot:14532316-Alexandrium_andersonii.AAC.1
MSASLVGSEMCIRDSLEAASPPRSVTRRPPRTPASTMTDGRGPDGSGVSCRRNRVAALAEGPC